MQPRTSSITVGGLTTQDFTLSTAPSGDRQRNGDGRLGCATGRSTRRSSSPRPARRSSPCSPDPVTGHYSIPLVTGNTFKFAITADGAATQPGGGLLPLDPVGGGGVTANWTLPVDPMTCDAPGYSRTGLSESFDGGVVPPGWSLVTTSGSPWSVVTEDPCGNASDNLTGGSGPFAVSANGSCNGAGFDDSELRHPPGGHVGLRDAPPFRSRRRSSPDPSNIADVRHFDRRRLELDERLPSRFAERSRPRAAHDRHHAASRRASPTSARGSTSTTRSPRGTGRSTTSFLGDPTCVPGDGGLVVGNVLDANTALGLNGARSRFFRSPAATRPRDVRNAGGPGAAGRHVHPLRGGGPAVLPGLARPVHAARPTATSVVFHGAVRLDFQLPAGRLDASPRPLSARVEPGRVGHAVLSIMVNGGGASATFELIELDVPPASARRRSRARSPIPRGSARRWRAFRRAGSTTGAPSGLPALPRAPAATAPLGGAATSSTRIRRSSPPAGASRSTPTPAISGSPTPGQFGGDDLEYRYLDGRNADRRHDRRLGVGRGLRGRRRVQRAHGHALAGQRRAATTASTSSIPFFRAATGNKICALPWSGISQRGLAYDVLTDTYYVGGWNEGVIYHVDGPGTVLDSTFVGDPDLGPGLQQPDRPSLRADQPWPSAPGDVRRLRLRHAQRHGRRRRHSTSRRTASRFRAFAPSEARAWRSTAPAGSGSSIRSGQTIFEVESGEINACAFNDIPWLSESPTEGTVAGELDAADRVYLRLDGSVRGPAPGTAQAPDGYALQGCARCRWISRCGSWTWRTATCSSPFIYAAAGAGDHAGLRPGGVPVLPDGSGDAGGHGGVHPAGGARGGFRAGAVRGSVSGRVGGGLQRGLHPVVLRRGVHGGVRGRQLLSRRGAHAWPDGGVHLEGDARAGYVPPPCGSTHVFDDVACPATPRGAVWGLDRAVVRGRDHGWLRRKLLLSEARGSRISRWRRFWSKPSSCSR